LVKNRKPPILTQPIRMWHPHWDDPIGISLRCHFTFMWWHGRPFW